MSSEVVDLLVVGGHLLDPSLDLDGEADIAVKNGRIAAVEKNLSEKYSAAETVDASGLYVSAGWVDLHTHVYEHATELGVNADSRCLRRGVTSAVDGGSAGCMTLAGLRHYVAERSRTRVLAFVHVACHGLAGAGCSGEDFGPGGESDHLNAIRVRQCVESAANNRDLVVGVKVRLDRNITDEGRTEEEVFRRAMQAARTAQVPLMVHHTNSGIPLGGGDLSCPGSLKPGDIYTHLYSGVGSNILTADGKNVDSSVKSAQSRGVIMDLGHGQGSFDWVVAEVASKAGFWPDVVSSDLHSGNVGGPARDLAHVMSKVRALGMPLKNIINAVTYAPAKAISRDGEFGRLSKGLDADLTIFKIDKPCEPEIGEDCAGRTRELKEVFRPKMVIRHGKKFDCADE